MGLAGGQDSSSFFWGGGALQAAGCSTLHTAACRWVGSPGVASAWVLSTLGMTQASGASRGVALDRQPSTLVHSNPCYLCILSSRQEWASEELLHRCLRRPGWSQWRAPGGLPGQHPAGTATCLLVWVLVLQPARNGTAVHYGASWPRQCCAFTPVSSGTVRGCGALHGGSVKSHGSLVRG